MRAIKAALGDGVLTFMWVFCASCLGILTGVVATTVGVQGLLWPSLLIATVFVFLLFFTFAFIGHLLGGASFNPTSIATIYAAGLASDSLFLMALRFPAQLLSPQVTCFLVFVIFSCFLITHIIQPYGYFRKQFSAFSSFWALGAVYGSLLIKDLMPVQYKHMLRGPSLKVDLHSGAIAEGVLTFIMNFAVLSIVIKGPRNPLLKTWLLSMTTVTLITFGSSFTGPSMNPANAFGWAYVNNRHNTWEHFYVYWICPFIGAVSAAWIFRALFAPPVLKEKKT